MAFTSGQSGNPDGRKKGTPNKITSARREFVKGLLDEEEKNIKAVLSKVKSKSPKVYLDFINQMMEFDTPKLTRQEIKLDDDNQIKIEIVRKNK